MHLAEAAAHRIDQTVAAIDSLGVRRVAPLHCTGARASAQFWTTYPSRCLECTVGFRWP
jgi:metal-dependent hydrolase (beta-lactamase superfamily II)